MSLSDFKSRYFEHESAPDGVTVIQLTQSHLTDEDNIEVFGTDLLNLPDQYDCQKIVVDSTHVVYVTSSVLGKLITLHRKLHRSNGSMVLCCIGSEFMEVLQTSRLHSYFTIADDVAAATQKLQDDSEDDSGSKVG